MSTVKTVDGHRACDSRFFRAICLEPNLLSSGCVVSKRLQVGRFVDLF